MFEVLWPQPKKSTWWRSWTWTQRRQLLRVNLDSAKAAIFFCQRVWSLSGCNNYTSASLLRPRPNNDEKTQRMQRKKLNQVTPLILVSLSRTHHVRCSLWFMKWFLPARYARLFSVISNCFHSFLIPLCALICDTEDIFLTCASNFRVLQVCFSCQPGITVTSCLFLFKFIFCAIDSCVKASHLSVIWPEWPLRAMPNPRLCLCLKMPRNCLNFPKSLSRRRRRPRLSSRRRSSWATPRVCPERKGVCTLWNTLKKLERTLWISVRPTLQRKACELQKLSCTFWFFFSRHSPNACHGLQTRRWNKKF